jgi:hypothetical protein
VDIAALEAGLNELVTFQGPSKQAPPYPLTASGTPLEQDMHNELEASWQAFHATRTPEKAKANALERVQKLQVRGDEVMSPE